MINFKFPSKEKLETIGKNERLNLYRRYFAASRYNRLLIQKQLLKCAYDELLFSSLKELERSHDQDLIDKLKIVKEYGLLEEFVDAVKEEEQSLQKIIEAYDKRMMNQYLP